MHYFPLKIRPILSFLCIICLCQTGTPQDMHMTCYQANTPYFNPAVSGDFRGFIKAGTSFRSQYEGTYEQALLHADANFFSPFHAKHWISAGIQLSYDVAGQLKAGQRGTGVQTAYHFPLDKKEKRILSIGIQVSRLQLSISTDAYKSESTLSGIQDPDFLALQQFQPSLLSIGMGTSLTWMLSKKSVLRTGLALMHSNRPAFRQVADTSAVGHRWNGNIGLRHTLNRQCTLTPGLFLSRTGQFTTASWQCLAEYKLTPKSNWALMAGLNHRWDESVSLITGYASERMMACVVVDVLTGAPAGTIANPGALELSAFYIFNRYTRPKTIPVVKCPRL